MNKEFEQWIDEQQRNDIYDFTDIAGKVYEYLQANPHLLNEQTTTDKIVVIGQSNDAPSGQELPKFYGERDIETITEPQKIRFCSAYQIPDPSCDMCKPVNASILEPQGLDEIAKKYANWIDDEQEGRPRVMYFDDVIKAMQDAQALVEQRWLTKRIT